MNRSIVRRAAGAYLVTLVLVFGAHGQCDPQETFKLLASGGGAGDEFGNSVAISGTVAIVGARWDDDNGSYSGSAYAFELSSAVGSVLASASATKRSRSANASFFASVIR